MVVGRYLALFAVLWGCAPAPAEEEPRQVVPFAPSEQPAFGDVPWPSDLHRSTEGVGPISGLERVATAPAPLADGLADLDGFARSTGALFFVDADVDDASLPSSWEAQTDPSVLLVDVDPDSPRRGQSYPVLAKALPSLDAVSVILAPGAVLEPGVRYAAVLTDRVRTVGGRALAPHPRLKRTWQIPASERVEKVDHLYGAASDELLRSGSLQSADQIVSLAVFTTSTRAAELATLRDQVRALPAPELALGADVPAPLTAAIFTKTSSPSLDDWLGQPALDEHGVPWPGGDDPGGIAHDAIAAVVTGAFSAPSFLAASTDHFERDAAGFVVQREEWLPFTLVLPSGPMPAAGYPVVIHGHGLSNHRASLLSTAGELARAGFAVIGIDDVKHGARAGVKDEKNNFPGSYDGPDGLPDTMTLPLGFFAGFSDFIAVRDHFRQTVIDHVSLVRLLQTADFGAVGGKLDAARIAYSGGSLGGIMGAMIAAVEPEIGAFALHVPGASFVPLITTSSPKVAPLVTSVAVGSFGIVGDEALDPFHPVASLIGAITEAGDPIAYAPHVFGTRLVGGSPPNVLVTYAAQDEVLPNLSTHALIRALGIPRAGPHGVSMDVADAEAPVHDNLEGRTAAAVEYGPANHALGYQRFDTREFAPDLPRASEPRFPQLAEPFSIEMAIREHAAQLITFLGQGRIEITAPARPDFDGDGVDDADELMSGTNPADPLEN